MRAGGRWRSGEGEQEPGVVYDRDGALHQRYGVESECLFLIRPDQYVAFRAHLAQPDDEDAFFAYLRGVFRDAG